jgi:hypothetical protein
LIFSANIRIFKRTLQKRPLNTFVQDGSIGRNFNDTTYPYTFTATFELQSRHLVLNATEEHENPYFLFSGNLVFRNEDGKIEVK